MQLNGLKTFMPAVITKLQKKLGDTDGVSTLIVSAGCCFFLNFQSFVSQVSDGKEPRLF